ncbi:MAG: DNA internalization-related competence protein ComEC/Rec2 [Methylococcales bacterium]|nr:DNA internalization-related competence protein ComEC/Rec2 [Methylococcales bacterium]
MSLSVLSFVTGIIVVQQFSALPELAYLLAIILLILLFAFFRYWLLVFFFFGMVWAIAFANIRLADRLPDEKQGKIIQVEGKVVGLPKYDDRRVRFDFAPFQSKNNLPEKIRLNWYFPKQQIKAGQTWLLTVKLKKPYGLFNSSGFDYEGWLFSQNIAATGYVRDKPAPQLISTKPLWKSVDVIRQHISDKLTILLKDSKNISVVKALTIGVKYELSPEQWKVFRQTGTVHLLAISGLHIGLISGLAFFVSLWLGGRFGVTSPQKQAAIIAISIATFYSALAGFSLPTQRSLLMLSIVMMTLVWQRNITPVNTLSITMLAVLLYDPLAVLSVGFWLSFLAVFLIVYSLAGRLGKAGYWQGAIKIHFITALGLAPLLIFYFQQFSIIAPIANFITVPIISLLVVPLCLLGVMLMFLSSTLASYVFDWVDHVLQGLWLVLIKMAELPFASITVIPPPTYTLPFALLGMLILLAPKGMPARYLGVVLLLPLLFVSIEKPKDGAVVMTLLDVGQGLSAVIETKKHTLVFDTGAKYSEQFDMGSTVVLPFLKSKGIDIVDILLISHGDNDHIGGAGSILKQTNVSQVLTSVPNKLKQYSPTQCQAEQSWVWDQVNFEILSPTIGSQIGDNNNSCVLKVTSKQGSFLLTGDIEKSAEYWLLDNKVEKLASDVLIAPHHGSKTSSTLAFLTKVDADIILIPSGYRNRFSFPHKQVIKRYKELGIDWVNTSDHGALTVSYSLGKIVIKSARLEKRKYWNN